MADVPAYDPSLGLSDDDYLKQLALLDAQLYGPPTGAPTAPLVPAPMPVDTTLQPPRGSNERLPNEPPPPPPPPPPDAQQVGFVPVPAAAGAIDETAAPAAPPAGWTPPPGPGAGILPAAEPAAAGPSLDDQLTPSQPSTGIGWLDEQLRQREAAPPPEPELTAEEQAAQLLGDPNAAEELRFNLGRERSDIVGRGSQDALRKFHEDETEATAEHAAAKKRAAEKLAAVDAEAQALNNTKIDNGHWWSSRSTFQQIAAVLAAVAGGFSSVRTGRNAPLEMIMRAIDQDIETQKANIANKRASVADRRNALATAYERLGDMELAEATVRRAAYDKAIAEAQTAAQQFDPKGTQALAYYDTITQLAQRRAEAWDAAQQKVIDNEVKVGTYNLAVRADARAERKANQAGRGAGLEKTVFTPDQWSLLHPGNPVPPLPMNPKDYDAWLRGEKTGQELAKTKNEVIAGGATASSETLARTIPDQQGQPYLQPDGKPLVAVGGPESVTKARDIAAGADLLVDLLDEAMAIRTGWTSDAAKSAEWRELKANWNAAKMTAKDVLELGVIQGKDEEFINGFLGTDDPTEYRDPSAGIKKARENIQRFKRSALGKVGLKEPGRYDKPWINPKVKPPVTKEDEYFKAAQGEVFVDEAFEDEIAEERQQTGVDYRTASKRVLARNLPAGVSVDAADAKKWVVPSTTRSLIDKYREDLRRGDAQAQERARARLTDLTSKGGNKGIQDAARLALIEGSDVVEPDQKVRVTVPDEFGGGY